MAKYETAHREQMEDARTGKTYESGVALATAKRNAKEKLTAALRNPKGTPKHLLRCPYYPHFCQIMGHTSASSKACGVHDVLKEERKILLDRIKELTIEQELVQVRENGKYCNISFHIEETFQNDFELISYYILPKYFYRRRGSGKKDVKKYIHCS